jgi:uncharacterized protein YcbX
MSAIGRVDSVWRYPVKSMRGEEMPEIFAGFSGIYGDRLFAFTTPAAPAAFPYLTARQCREMLRFRPRFRDGERAAKPAHLAAAEQLSPILNPIVPDPGDLALDVETPSGEVLAIDDPALSQMLGEGLSLLRSERAITDCRPVSLLSVQTAARLGEEVGTTLDKRRFRANVYLDLAGSGGFAEDALVGRRLRIGAKAVIAVVERDPRCQMITLDPETAEANPEILRRVARDHDRNAGVYGVVLAEGLIRAGDPVEALD